VRSDEASQQGDGPGSSAGEAGEEEESLDVESLPPKKPKLKSSSRPSQDRKISKREMTDEEYAWSLQKQLNGTRARPNRSANGASSLRKRRDVKSDPMIQDSDDEEDGTRKTKSKRSRRSTGGGGGGGGGFNKLCELSGDVRLHSDCRAEGSRLLTNLIISLRPWWARTGYHAHRSSNDSGRISRFVCIYGSEGTIALSVAKLDAFRLGIFRTRPRRQESSVTTRSEIYLAQAPWTHSA
jgi:hypothetical protein